MNKVLKNNRLFFITLLLISTAGFIIRYVNINYASLWADELYSAILASPENSWYEVLYLQRAYQPPLYAFSLWVWVKIFAYNEFYIKLFTVLAGTAGIFVSGLLGKKVHSAKFGILLALFVAFNPMHIWYSLEARFYVFIYLFATLSILLYTHINSSKKSPWYIYIFKAITDAALLYFHHFGFLLLLAQFVYDVIIWKREKNTGAFVKKAAGYFLSGLLYLPWVIFGLTEALKVKQYWLQKTDIAAYLAFAFEGSGMISIFFYAAIILFLLRSVRNKKNLFFPLICLVVTIVPVIYSYVRMPLLVPRYAMVMVPAVFVMTCLGLLYGYNLIRQHSGVFSKLFATVVLFLLILPGVYITLFNKERLQKQPWRQMGEWLNSQPDIDAVNVYSLGAYVKKKKNIDFYLKMNHSSLHINDIVPGKENKMYLVETDGVWKLQDSILNAISNLYDIKKQHFKHGDKEWGNVYSCTIKTVQSK